MMSLDRREDQSGKQISFNAHSNLSELHTLHIMHNTIIKFLHFSSKKRWVEKKTRCVLENEKINLESNFHFWLRCMHRILHIASVLGQSKANPPKNASTSMKRAWTLAKESDVTWQQEDQSEKQFPFHAHLLQFCLSSPLHLASLYQGNQKQIFQMTPPLKLQIKGNWHWQLSKLRSTLTYPAKRVWCWHFIENLTERKVQKPSLGWKVMNCWRDPVDKK